jgi:site-specific recombinase XerD
MNGLRFFLKDPKAKVETPLMFSYIYAGERVKSTTKQKIKPRAWNQTAQSVRRNFTEYSDVQKELTRIEIVISEAIQSLTSKYSSLPPKEELKRLLNRRIFMEDVILDTTSLWDYFDYFISKLSKRKNPTTNRPIAKSTISAYNQTLQILKSFEEETGNVLSFLTLSNQTYDNLIEFLEEEEYSVNTLGKHIKNLKCVLNRAKTEDNIPISESYNSNYWKVYKRDKSADEIVFLNEAELKELVEMDLPKFSIADRTRDIFLIGAWTGLRISDIIEIEKSNIHLEEGVLKIRTAKSDSFVVVPMIRTIEDILIKYDFKAPKISKPVINKEIKILCSRIESLNEEIFVVEQKGGKLLKGKFKKFEKVGTHTGRRSFASNFYRQGYPAQQIMAATGHKKEKDFYKYIGVTKGELAMDFAKEIKKKYG